MAGVSCIKYIVFLCNLLFALTGLLILSIGAIVQSNYHHYSNFVGDSVWTAPIILMIVGVVVFIIGFLGCCGAVNENSCMIMTFSILIILIFLLEIGVGVAGYIKHGELRPMMEKQFEKTMMEYNDRPEYRDAWNIVQSELSCCGTNGPKDWYKSQNMTILPSSCCNVTPVDAQCTEKHANQDGCLQKLLAILDSKALILAGVVITVALIQLLTIFYACCLYKSFRPNYETV